MKIDLIPDEKNSILEIEINFSDQDLFPYKEKVLKVLQENLEIKGFRKGKAPLELVEKNFSPTEIYEKALKEAIEDIYPQILNENKIKALGFPEIEVLKLIPNQEAQVKIAVSYLQDFTLPDYKEIAKDVKKEKKEVNINQKEIDEAINFILNSYASFEPIDKEAKKGDLVTIDYQIFEGENLIKNGEEKNYSFFLGNGHFLPGFEEQIENMKKNEEKEFSLKVPENWPEESLRNKELKVKVTLKEVKEKKLPVLDENFLKKLGDFQSKEELENVLKESLKIQKENKERDRIRILMLERLIEKTQISIPKILIDIEIERMIEELKMSLEDIQLTFEEYLQQIKKTEEELREGFKELALKRVKARLILEKISETENIQISEEEKNKKAEEIYYSLREEEQKKINPFALKDYAEEVLRNEKVFELLENIE